MNRIAVIAALALGLAACTDSDSSNNSPPGAGNPPPTMPPTMPPVMPPVDPPPEQSVVLNVGVFAPVQNFSAAQRSGSATDLLAGLLGSKAVAQGTNGYAPVNNVTLRVQVISADGSVTRTLDAPVRFLGNGRYEVNLPPGEDIASDCIIVTEGQLNTPLRVPLVRRDINITPITEFVAAQLACGTLNYDNISLDELSDLLDQVDGIEVPEDSNGSIEAILAALADIAGIAVNSAIAEAEADNQPPAADPSIAYGRYQGQYLELGMQGFDGDDDVEPNGIPPNGSIDVNGAGFFIAVRSDGNEGSEVFFNSDGSDEFDFELFNRRFAFGDTSPGDTSDSGTLPVRVLANGVVVIPAETERDLPAAGAENSFGESVGSIEIAAVQKLYPAAGGAILLDTYRLLNI